MAAHTVAVAQPAPEPTLIEAILKDGKIVGTRTLRARQGDRIELRVATDRSIVLHLHGYDIERTAEPDTPAVFDFPARATGRFAMEEHLPASATKKGHAHPPAIFYLEVRPR